MTEMTKAAQDVLAERQRQVEVEGWTPKHDDQHSDFSMAQAAAGYAMGAAIDEPSRLRVIDWREGDADYYMPDDVIMVWPHSWLRGWWKPTTRRADLVKAAALLLAEIERLDRIEAKG